MSTELPDIFEFRRIPALANDQFAQYSITTGNRLRKRDLKYLVVNLPKTPTYKITDCMLSNQLNKMGPSGRFDINPLNNSSSPQRGRKNRSVRPLRRVL